MSKRLQKLPKYGLHKPTGQARVVLDGHSHYLGQYETEESHENYQRLISSWIANNRALPEDAGGPSDLTISELVLAFLRFAEGYYVKNGTPTSEFGCIKLAMRPLNKLYGRTLASDFGPLKLKSVRQVMIDGDLSRGVINQHVCRIKRAFRWGAENELVAASVYHGVQSVRGLSKGRSEARETEPIKPVPDQHVDAIKNHVSPQVWAMIQVQRLTGMRPGEARMMRGCEVDMTGRLWDYRPSGHKNQHHDRERVVPIGPRTQAVIRPFLKKDLEAFLFSPCDAEATRNAKRRRDRKSPMTPSQKMRKPKSRKLNDFYTKDAYIAAIRRACERAGVPSWHPNQLRHSSGTRVRKELGLEAAQV